jgi:tetratricopeptide (TPR) repeat protein
VSPGIPRAAWLGVALVVLATIAAYGRVAGFGFIENYDDSIYVTQNPHVRTGWTLANVAWAFSRQCAGNWHPLTMLSHMTDCQLFGLSPGPPHLVNLLLHVLDTLLLFYVLSLSTGRAWPSLFVAGLFALHPTHVESVAWVAERKDVLSTLLWLLTMWAYVGYARRGGPTRYAAVIVLFAIGLLAKPMLVTLPFVLILFDYWPLDRIRATREPNPARGVRAAPMTRILLEKLPLLLLVVVSVALTLRAQKSVGALSDTVSLPLALRVSNAFLAYAAYVSKLVLPRGLAALYPYPVTIELGAVLAAALALLAVTALLVGWRRQAPYALVGWLWFLGTLVPVIGIVQVGSQSMADRYTYVPHIGLDIAIAWGCAEAVRRWRVGRTAVVAAATAVLMALSVVTWIQVGYWKDGRSLFGHAIEVTSGNFIAYSNYGVDALAAGRLDEALTSFQTAVRINPRYATGLYNLGVALRKKAMYPQAVEALTKSLAIAPRDPRTETNLAMALAVQQRFTESFPHYEAALRLAPDESEVRVSYSNALSNYGAQLGQTGHRDEALRHFQRALEVNPGNDAARRNLEYEQGRAAPRAGSSAAAPAARPGPGS